MQNFGLLGKIDTRKYYVFTDNPESMHFCDSCKKKTRHMFHDSGQSMRCALHYGDLIYVCQACKTWDYKPFPLEFLQVKYAT